MMWRSASWTLACLLAGAVAGAQGAERLVDTDALREIDPAIVTSPGFEAGHPDMWFRRLGVQAREAGRLAEARTWFRRAGRFGDKLSQAAYAEMLWEGQGGDRDPVLGYIWMDLAAERGAPWLLALREQYWDALDAGQRARVPVEGEAVFAEHADAVALPRLERRMRRVARNATGSRTGWVGPMDIYIGMDAGGGSSAPVRGDRYYAARYWDPETYQRWQNDLLRTPVRDGRVDVGLPETVGRDD